MKDSYLDVVSLIERLHRQFLEVVKFELDNLGIQDLNNIQAIILYNIAGEKVTVGELTNRGYYLGSNVSYNLKKMVENGYLVQERSPHDRRSVRVRLSDKGVELRNIIVAMFDRQIGLLDSQSFSADQLKSVASSLDQLGRFFNSTLTLSGRGVAGPPGGLDRRADLP